MSQNFENEIEIYRTVFFSWNLEASSIVYIDNCIIE